MFVLPTTQNHFVKRRRFQGLLVLEMRGEVDAVVLTDVTDGGGRKLLGLGRDAMASRM